MSSRENILSRIRTALKDDAPVDRPPVPEVWARTDAGSEQKVERFTQEIEGVAGEVHRCASMGDARRKLSEVLGELDPGKIGAAERPLVREVTSEVPSDRIHWADPMPNAPTMAEWSASVVAADCLVADTGTVMVACHTPHERLLCYLPPVCIAVASTDRLFEHLPAAWGEIAQRAADTDLRGEFVFITGPSRTADIEKILILGVHGPKRLVVLLLG
jgi:L-lactate dehydrogenase complex protein LldG